MLPFCTFSGVGVVAATCSYFHPLVGDREVKKEQSKLWKLSGSESVVPRYGMTRLVLVSSSVKWG